MLLLNVYWAIILVLAKIEIEMMEYAKKLGKIEI